MSYVRFLVCLLLLAGCNPPAEGEVCECGESFPGMICELYVPSPAEVDAYRGEIGPGWQSCYWRNPAP